MVICHTNSRLKTHKKNHVTKNEEEVLLKTSSLSPIKKHLKIGPERFTLLIIALLLCVKNPGYAVKAFCSDTVSYTFHELAHALIAKYLWDNPIKIGIGSSAPTQDPIFKHENFILEWWYPFGGYSYTTRPMKKTETGHLELDKKKQAIMKVAGGIGGALGHLLIELIHRKLIKKEPISINVFYNYGIAEQLLENVLIPSGEKTPNDAQAFFDECLEIKAPAFCKKIHPFVTPILWLTTMIMKMKLSSADKEYFVRKVMQSFLKKPKSSSVV
jgi:hypothetical protein